MESSNKLRGIKLQAQKFIHINNAISIFTIGYAFVHDSIDSPKASAKHISSSFHNSRPIVPGTMIMNNTAPRSSEFDERDRCTDELLESIVRGVRVKAGGAERATGTPWRCTSS